MAEMSPKPPGAHEACLQWVLLDGELHHVSDFAHLKPPDRPEVCCPACQRPVIMRLGNIRVHHVAHRPEDSCSATQPETALHLNCKFYLQAELRKGRRLLIEERCKGVPIRFLTHRCESTRWVLWAKSWDDVATECQLGPYRLDVGLLREGQVIGAIEVLVTHEMEPEKIEYLNQQGIRWLEVQGEASLYEGGQAWHIDKPLRFKRPIVEQKWQCEKCVAAEQEAIRKTELRAKEERRKAEYRSKNYREVTSMKIVDFYFRSGKKYRDVYRVVQQVRNAKVVAIAIHHEDDRLVAMEKGPVCDNVRQKLEKAFRAHLSEYEARGAIVDEPMKWQKWPQRFHPKMAHDEGLFPRRYWWNGSQWELIDQDMQWDGYWGDQLTQASGSKSQSDNHVVTRKDIPYRDAYETDQGTWVTPNKGITYHNLQTGEILGRSDLMRMLYPRKN